VNEYLDAWGIISGLGAGLALFLYGMERLTGSLNSLAGPELTRMLAAVTNNRLKAATTGAIITAIIQSSSITTVMCVGFISAGLITLKQAVGVILGANVGTTITAQVFAFDITRLAFPLIIVGMLLRLVASRKLVHHLGTVIFGLGLLFFGMVLMSHSTYPLRQHPSFLDLMKSLIQGQRGDFQVSQIQIQWSFELGRGLWGFWGEPAHETGHLGRDGQKDHGTAQIEEGMSIGNLTREIANGRNGLSRSSQQLQKRQPQKCPR